MNFKSILTAVFCLLICAQARSKASSAATEKLNIIKYCDVKTSPCAVDLKPLFDGDTASWMNFQGGPEIAGIISFYFPEPLTIKKIRFFQNAKLGAKDYRIKLDTTGNGNFDKIALLQKNQKIKGGEWISHDINEKAHALMFEPISGKPGYRTPYPRLCEFEIYTQEKLAAKPQQTTGAFIEKGKELSPPAVWRYPDEKGLFKLIVCFNNWHAGINKYGHGTVSNFSQYPPFKKFVAKLKKLGASKVRYFPEGSCLTDKMPWPSKLCNNLGTKKLNGEPDINILKELTKALHKENIKISVLLHDWITPLQRRTEAAFARYGYPREQSDRNPKRPEKYKSKPFIKYPCIISDPHFRDTWLKVMEEIASNGVDGINIVTDEYYYKGHSMAREKCENCAKGFKKMYGYESLPSKSSDSEKYKKWKLFEYRQLAKLFKTWAVSMKEKYPKVKLTALAHNAFYYAFNLRLDHGICYDLIGQELAKHVDMIGGTTANGAWLPKGHAVTAAARRSAAAFDGENKLIMFLTFVELTRSKVDHPLKIISQVINLVFSGVKNVGIYRYNYIFRNGWDAPVSDAVKMAKILEKWGIYHGRAPAETCLLYSRASEDWWQVKINAMLKNKQLGTTRTTLWDRPDLSENEMQSRQKMSDRELQLQRFRGMISDRCLETILLENGVQYDFVYADQKLPRATEYKQIIVPFAHCVSERAVAWLQKAAENGKQILVFNMLGEQNEFGVKRPEPALLALSKLPNVKFLKADFLHKGSMKSFKAKIIEEIKSTMQNNLCNFDSHGLPVDFLVRKINENELALMIANHSNAETVTPSISLNLPKGNYNVELCDGKAQVYQGLIEGKPYINSQQLKEFNLALEPQSIILLKISKITESEKNEK